MKRFISLTFRSHPVPSRAQGYDGAIGKPFIGNHWVFCAFDEEGRERGCVG
jgi:hypothetical protein